ncbi:MAG: type II secretion system F family protein [Lachnospiraceae bacterium]|nr:type II secretion system F family protein [Lachnospiraceae bacterium]
MTKSCAQPDYREYHFRTKEKLFYILEGILLVAMIGYFFYQSWAACLCLTPVLVLFMKEKKKDLAKRQRQELSIQFKDLILAVAANQKAGYSIENAFREAYKDMEMLYGREGTICIEIKYIIAGLDNNIVLEKLIYNLGMRSGLPDIIQFADVFFIAKRSGGNMTDILQKSAAVIEQKTETDKEIQLMISAKKMEQKIMNMVPFLIIFYVSSTSKGFFDVLYHNMIGIIIMTVCLGFYMAAYLLSKRIVDIEV